MIIVTVTHSLD